MDFSNIREVSEIKQLIDKSVEYIRSQPNSSLLTLTNIEGMHFNSEIKNMFSDFVSGNKPHVKTGAVIGLNGLQRIVYNGLMKITGRDIRSFDNINVAKDWLSTRN
jgi:hypothetical protein